MNFQYFFWLPNIYKKLQKSTIWVCIGKENNKSNNRNKIKIVSEDDNE